MILAARNKMLGVLVLLAVIQFCTASFCDQHCRLHHSWPSLLDNNWFDRPFDAFDSAFADPFNNLLLESHWSDERLSSSFEPSRQDTSERDAIVTSPNQDMSNLISFKVDTHGFHPDDLTVKIIGHDVAIEGYRKFCDFASCYNRHYYLQKTLPNDVDMGTVKASLMANQDILHVQAQRIKESLNGNSPLPEHFTATENDTKRNLNTSDKGYTLTDDGDDTTIEVVQD